jgi:2-methylisocitrate lyase-like PEP mutase family enzyme
MTDLAAKAQALRELHRPGDPLVLANAWDVSTAKQVVAAGFPAVATTSSGVSWSLGHEDGEDTPADEMFEVAARIAAAVDVPVTADLESGYGMSPAELVESMRRAPRATTS